MVKCYKTKNLDSYYLEMELGFTNKLLYDYDTAIKKIKGLEEENKKLKSDLSLVIKERDDNIEQNKKLKSDLAFKNTMLDNVSAEYDCSQDFIKKLKKRVKEHTTYSVKAEFIKKFGE